MFSIQHCSVAAICVAGVCENHSHCDAKSQPGDTIPRRVIGMAVPRLRKPVRDARCSLPLNQLRVGRRFSEIACSYGRYSSNRLVNQKKGICDAGAGQRN